MDKGAPRSLRIGAVAREDGPGAGESQLFLRWYEPDQVRGFGRLAISARICVHPGAGPILGLVREADQVGMCGDLRRDGQRHLRHRPRSQAADSRPPSPPASTRTRGRPAFISTRAAAMADSSFGQSQNTTSSRPSEKQRAASEDERSAMPMAPGIARASSARAFGRAHVDHASGLRRRQRLRAARRPRCARCRRRAAPCGAGDSARRRRRRAPARRAAAAVRPTFDSTASTSWIAAWKMRPTSRKPSVQISAATVS